MQRKSNGPTSSPGIEKSSCVHLLAHTDRQSTGAYCGVRSPKDWTLNEADVTCPACIEQCAKVLGQPGTIPLRFTRARKAA